MSHLSACWGFRLEEEGLCLCAAAYGEVTATHYQNVYGAVQIFRLSDQVMAAARFSTVFIALARRGDRRALGEAITQCKVASRSTAVAILITDGPIDGIDSGNFATIYSNFDSMYEELK